MPLFRLLVLNEDHPRADKNRGDVIAWVHEGKRFGRVEEGEKEGPCKTCIVVVELENDDEVRKLMEQETREVVEGRGLERVVTQEVINNRKRRIDLDAIEAEPESRVEMQGRIKKIEGRGMAMTKRVIKSRVKRTKKPLPPRRRGGV